MATVAKTQYRVRIAWDQSAKGLFTLGRSQLGGTDVLAYSTWDATFNGTYDDITSLVDPFGQITITRGRSDDEQTMQAGQAVIPFRDGTGLLDPENASSPLAGKLVPNRPLTIEAYDPVGLAWELLFYGFLERIAYMPGTRRGTGTISATDLMTRLGGDNGPKPTIPSTGPTTTGAAIGKVLDAIEWTTPSMRSLATGDVVPDFSADPATQERTALQLIEDLLEPEGGAFFASRTGAATYVNRYARFTGASLSTVADTMTGMERDVDIALIRNRQACTKTGSTQQVAFDDASERKYGTFQGDEIVSPYFENDNAALGRAQWEVVRGRTPVSRARSIVIDNRTSALLQAIIKRDLQDKVTVSETATPQTATDYIVEAIRHTITLGGAVHSCEWLLAEPQPPAVFVLGTSALGSVAVLG